MNMSQSPNEGFVQPRIIRGQVDSLSLFEITDYELEILEQGTPNSIHLNFAVLFISIAVSFLITLLTVKIDSTRVFIVFTLLTIVGFSVGIILFILWYRTKATSVDVIKKIKARAPLKPISNTEGNIEQTEASEG